MGDLSSQAVYTNHNNGNSVQSNSSSNSRHHHLLDQTQDSFQDGYSLNGADTTQPPSATALHTTQHKSFALHELCIWFFTRSNRPFYSMLFKVQHIFSGKLFVMFLGCCEDLSYPLSHRRYMLTTLSRMVCKVSLPWLQHSRTNCSKSFANRTTRLKLA